MAFPYDILPWAWDEMKSAEGIRPGYEVFYNGFSELNRPTIEQKQRYANELFLNQGITFTVYSDNEGIERIFPFDIVPRIIRADEWDHIESGIRQRLKALNLFLNDIYSEQQILKDRIVPAALVTSCPNYLREAHGIRVPHNIYIHISGIDLIRGTDGTFYVLEDNLRTPSGVSYMLENREITKRILPNKFANSNVRMVSNYPLLLNKTLNALAPTQVTDPTVVLLTPGIHNSAYYEHTFLARQMGIQLVEARDLVVDNQKVFMKTTSGLKQVHVIYRRIDDDFLDPLVFRSDSVLGVPGLMSAYRKGNVALANAVGNGVADDKAVYAYVPEMIRYYLNEEPVLPNIPTYHLSDPEQLEHVNANIGNMVIKETNQSGGYGMLMGNNCTEEEVIRIREAIRKNPRNFIAQPIIPLSTCPCFIDGKLTPRHIDLRPFAIYGPEGVEIVPGGLTRVALREGSLVVNSSQGGGSKDTWIVDL